MANMIKCLLVKSLQAPEVVEFECTLENLQTYVSGYIETVYPFPERVCLVCNEEGKLNGLPLNRAIRDTSGRIRDAIAGDFLIVGVDGSDFSSLTDEQAERYEEMFHQPECFINCGGQLLVVPYRKGAENVAMSIAEER